MERASGIIMALSSLPSNYGIGTLGKSAFDFVDFLSDANQKYWQILPVGPTSYGDSPYQSFSTFAGNPYFIDLDILKEEGLLTQEEIDSRDWGSDDEHVDYGKIYESRFDILKIACDRGYEKQQTEIDRFASENAGWLGNYCLFMAVKRKFGMKSWTEWPDDDIRLHKDSAVISYGIELSDDIKLFKFIQFKFFEQFDKLKKYAHEKGVKIIGDMPIYVALDSSDVWSEPYFFRLDENNNPTEVAGVPPDYFTEDGQLWGNPLYRWDRMKEDGYGWWIRRIAGNKKLYDVLRIDHFRGLESYWAVPYGEKTAKNGRWLIGPGIDFVKTITSWFSDMNFIAEDLGYLTPEVHELLEKSGLPGMKVLEFAFDSREPSNYLPHTYDKNAVCYVGTHDNATLKEWFKTADKDDIKLAKKYLGLNSAEGYNFGVIRGGMSSVADLFMTQMQDYLNLGAEARMNTPGTSEGNWRWRMKKDAIQDKMTERIAYMTKIYGRS